MVRKLFGILVGIASMALISVPAFGATPMMQISSWVPEFGNGMVIGGTQTVSLTNISSDTITNTQFSLEPIPCDCVIESYDTPDGSLNQALWTIESIEPGITVTLLVTYQSTDAVAAGSSVRDFTLSGRIATALSIGLLLTSLVLARPARHGIRI